MRKEFQEGDGVWGVNADGGARCMHGAWCSDGIESEVSHPNAGRFVLKIPDPFRIHFFSKDNTEHNVQLKDVFLFC